MVLKFFVVSPTLSSTIFYFVAGFFILLVIVLFIIAFSVMLSLIIVSLVHIFCEIFHHSLHEIHQIDLETGDTFPPLGDDIRRDRHDDDALRASSAQNNLQTLEMLDRIIRDLREGKGPRQNEMMQKALERLPPQVCYGTHDLKTSSYHKCVICLEDFKAGDSCQVFPVCDHIFHSFCVGNWLVENLTCPLCRTCMVERE